ncbi:MAG: YciI family protein [Sandarakinorhabdus sp.]|nr:YciI family protein [Sandarakinorhabdus sp.]
MPYFAIHCIDRPEAADLRAATRAAHLAHINARGDDVVVAGPLLRPDGRAMGSLLIIAFDDRDSAVAFAAADPYHVAGLFESRSITHWHKVLPA